MPRLTITRGLPGSGKTTWARTQPAWRVNRDDLRAMLNDQWPYGDRRAEDLLTSIQHHAIKTFLSVGFEVVVDDTNLHPLHVDAFRTIAAECDADLRIKDFTDVPLETCLERDAARPNPVGEKVIRGMWERFLASVDQPAAP